MVTDAEAQILIVDDDPVNIFALTAVLESRGFKSISATNATDAIGILSCNPAINLVLLDMMMPGMDGYHAIKYMRGVPGHARLVIIAVTAQAMGGDREKCLAAGADDYLPKPLDVDHLLLKLESYQSR